MGEDQAWLPRAHALHRQDIVPVAIAAVSQDSASQLPALHLTELTAAHRQRKVTSIHQ